ncbi:MAG: ethanolamine ammonia-lyase subunit EutC [Anaerolineaceae bacterium]|nr:ethanolamine ammonia-lyase subunit EutC [Anaerolineaceae bacterium]
MDQSELDAIIERVLKELYPQGKPADPSPVIPQVSLNPEKPSVPARTKVITTTELAIDLADPTIPQARIKPGIQNPSNPDGLQALLSSTTARIGVGRAGPRYRTRSWLLFQADQAITQDTLLRDVDGNLLKELGLFSVQTNITGGKQEYLLRPDLGRQLNDDARHTITEKCQKNVQVQLCVGDGLSAEAIETNIRQIFPVIQQGCQAAGLSMGTPFFIKYCRVGVMNDIGDLIKPEVLMLLIGERPGLGRAESMSIYMGYQPKAGDTDAERDVVCNIFDRGGTNPLEAGAYAVQFAKKMIQNKASGVKLKMMEK